MSPPPPLPTNPPAGSPQLAGLQHAFLWLFVYMGAVLFLYLLLYLYNTCIHCPAAPPLQRPPMAAEAPPAPPRRIRGGKVVRYANSYGKDCAICLDDFRDGEVCRVLSKCNHVYHKTCIDKWLTANPHCPLCRGSVHGSVHGSDSGSSHHYQRSSQNQIQSGVDQFV